MLFRSERKGYEMVLDRFGLINCDKFSGDTLNFNNSFRVSLPEAFTNVNTAVYVAFKNLNSVVALSGNASAKAFVTTGRGLPMGKAVTVITMSYIKDKFYFAKHEVTIQTTIGQTVRLTPVVMEKEGIKTLLNTL